MSRKNNVLSGTLSIAVLSIVVFLFIYFFYPNVSLKYFGVAFHAKQAVENSVRSELDQVGFLSENEKDYIEKTLTSEDGQKAIKALSEAAGNGKEAISSAMESDDVKKLQQVLSSSFNKEKLQDIMDSMKKSTEGLSPKFSK